MKEVILTTVFVLFAFVIATGLTACEEEGEIDDEEERSTDDIDEDSGVTPGSTDSGSTPGDDDGELPPPEAVEACDGKAVGDACEFIGLESETISGTCEQIEDLLACVPEGGPPIY